MLWEVQAKMFKGLKELAGVLIVIEAAKIYHLRGFF